MWAGIAGEIRTNTSPCQASKFKYGQLEEASLPPNNIPHLGPEKQFIRSVVGVRRCPLCWLTM
jgi:hypothetical protein